LMNSAISASDMWLLSSFFMTPLYSIYRHSWAPFLIPCEENFTRKCLCRKGLRRDARRPCPEGQELSPYFTARERRLALPRR
jgi:hypothetical protein